MSKSMIFIMKVQGEINTFKDLYAWQRGHELVLAVYRISNDFPATENFGLTNQMRRAAVSITSNLAEGFSRRSSKDKVHFYSMALGSLTELQNQLLIAQGVGYLTDDVVNELEPVAVITHKLTNGLIKSTKTRTP